MKYLRWLYRHSEGVRGRIVLNMVLDIANIGLNLYFIFLCKRIVDIATGHFEGSIVFHSILVVGVILLRLGLNAANTRLENLTVSRMNFVIRRQIYSHLLLAEWAGKEKMHSGDTLNRLETDVSKVTGAICSDVPQFVSTLVQLVAAVVFMCSMEWRLALLLVAITPVLLAFSRVFFRKIRAMTRSISDTESLVQSHLQESLQHRVLVRSMENEQRMQERLDDLQNTEYGQVVERTRYSIFTRTVISATFSLGYIAAFLWGAFGIMNGRLTFGMMTAFLQLVGQIQRPSVGLTRQIPAFINATTAIDRLMELEAAPKETTGEPQWLTAPAGVRVENLVYRYPDGDRDVVAGLDFDFAPGSRTAIVGETGAGKSTLIRLMLSLLKPVSGQVVLYDGEKALEASPMTRCNLVYVPQGNSLFSGSIRENLKMGDPEATEERMRWALGIAQADFVDGLPDGIDTFCGEGGAGLSEGQAQRIAIARGLLRPGSVLLLDEFSSSLDPQTEARLMESLAESSSGKTLIFITHREKIAEYCDARLELQSFD